MSFAKRIIERKQDARIMANRNRSSRKPYQGVGMFQYDLFGDDQLNQLFLAMDWTYQRQVIISAFRMSAKPMIDRMKQNLTSVLKGNRGTGTLLRSIGAYAWRDTPQLTVGTRKYGSFRGFHGHLIETGTVERERYSMASAEGEGKTGAVKPTYFFAKAINATQETVLARFRDDRLKAFDKFVTRYNKKAKT